MWPITLKQFFNVKNCNNEAMSGEIVKKIIVSLILCALVQTSTSFAEEANQTRSKKAVINCVFPKPSRQWDNAPKKIMAHIELNRGSVKASITWAIDEAFDQDWVVLAHNRTHSKKNVEEISTFQAFEKTRGTNFFTGPSNLVIAGNDGDDTDQTVIIQYERAAESIAELKANRAENKPDFTSVNMFYTSSCDGIPNQLISKKCEMKLE